MFYAPILKSILIKIKMTSFSSYLLVFFLASLILIPQGFGDHPHHDHPTHPPSTQGFGDHPIHPTNQPNPKKHDPHHPPKEDNTLPKPTYPANIPRKPPHHPPKEDNTHF
jgi:hypothetical protein